jgi:hypothetical protein
VLTYVQNCLRAGGGQLPSDLNDRSGGRKADATSRVFSGGDGVRLFVAPDRN